MVQPNFTYATKPEGLLLFYMIKTPEMNNTNISQSQWFIADAIFLSIGPIIGKYISLTKFARG